MHHAHAAQALFVRVANELSQAHARLLRAQAMQVNLTLNGPLTFA